MSIVTPTVGTRHRADRALLEKLLDALDASPSTLRRDECGDPRAIGSRGHVYAIAEAGAFYLVVGCQSVRGWSAAKRCLAFCAVSQDGDEEGVLRLDRQCQGGDRDPIGKPNVRPFDCHSKSIPRSPSESNAPEPR